MSQTVLIALGFGVGAVMAVYLPMVGTMGRELGSPILSTIPFFTVGLGAAILAALATGEFENAARFRQLSPWLPLAGVGAFLMILGSAYLIPRIGASTFFVAVVAGQLAVGAFVAHFGLLGSAVVPLGLTKVAGLLLVVFGAFLAVR